MAPADRVIVVVLDGVGIGELPDAPAYGDGGSDSLGNTARVLGGLSLPNMARLGLGNIEGVGCVPAAMAPRGAFGRMAELSPGKDTTTGHWEIAGLVLDKPFPVYPDGFPPELVRAFEERIGTRILGNRPASGTEIIKELGEFHQRTGFPIVYTSADSVFQVAAHEEVIPVERLYEMCRQAREMLAGEHLVGRVIARPFVGRPGGFVRTARRRDFGLNPPGKTLLDLVREAGLEVVTVGKVDEIFNGRGVSRAYHARNNEEALDFLEKVVAGKGTGLVFANLVDFDTLYGHRNDPSGYGAALEKFDARLEGLLPAMREGDVLFISSDHGCDPTTESTDHSREYVPLLVSGRPVRAGTCLGTRRSFADLGATAAELLGTGTPAFGRSFARDACPTGNTG